MAAPFALVLRITSPSSRVSTKRPRAVIGNVSSRGREDGGAPILPTEAWRFCSRMAALMSVLVILSWAMRSGFSQMRTA